MPFLLKFKLEKIFMRQLMRDVETYKEISTNLCANRISQGKDTGTKDVFYHLIGAEDPETGATFSRGELISESGLLMIAGTDTTAVTIPATIFYLLNNPRCLDALSTEILSTFSDIESIRSGTELGSCRYLKACIDESLRMTPPVPGLLQREVQAGGAVICGQHFPAGTIAGVPCYAVHHDARYFPEPFKFHPERWIESEQNPASAVATARETFFPFGVGFGSCAGKNMAMFEIQVVIARLIWLFEMRLAEKNQR